LKNYRSKENQDRKNHPSSLSKELLPLKPLPNEKIKEA